MGNVKVDLCKADFIAVYLAVLEVFQCCSGLHLVLLPMSFVSLTMVILPVTMFLAMSLMAVAVSLVPTLTFATPMTVSVALGLSPAVAGRVVVATSGAGLLQGRCSQLEAGTRVAAGHRSDGLRALDAAESHVDLGIAGVIGGHDFRIESSIGHITVKPDRCIGHRLTPRIQHSHHQRPGKIRAHGTPLSITFDSLHLLRGAIEGKGEVTSPAAGQGEQGSAEEP